MERYFTGSSLFCVSCITFLMFDPAFGGVVHGRPANPNPGELIPFDETRSKTSHLSVCTASVNVTSDLAGNITLMSTVGQYSTRSALYTISGTLVHVVDADGKHDACSPPVNVPHEPWIALVERGHCKFDHKLKVIGAVGNATGVIVYNHKDEDTLLMMDTSDHNLVSIFIHKSDGNALTAAAELGHSLKATISLKDITVFEIDGIETQTLPTDHHHSHSSAFSSVIFVIAGLIFVAVLILITIILCSFKTKLKKHRQRQIRVKFDPTPQQILYSVYSVNETSTTDLSRDQTESTSSLATGEADPVNESKTWLLDSIPMADEVEEEANENSENCKQTEPENQTV